MDRTPSTPCLSASTHAAAIPAGRRADGTADLPARWPDPGRETANLVRLAQAGDTSAFGALYEEHAPAIHRFLRRRMDGPDEVVEDLTAEVFVKVYEKLERYEERGLPFTAWLYRIARNHLIDHLRRWPRVATSSLAKAGEVPEQASQRATARVLDLRVLEPALARLPVEQRRTVELRFLHGLSVAETAALMDRSDEAVKKLQARGLVNLRRLLAPAS